MWPAAEATGRSGADPEPTERPTYGRDSSLSTRGCRRKSARTRPRSRRTRIITPEPPSSIWMRIPPVVGSTYASTDTASTDNCMPVPLPPQCAPRGDSCLAAKTRFARSAVSDLEVRKPSTYAGLREVTLRRHESTVTPRLAVSRPPSRTCSPLEHCRWRELRDVQPAQTRRPRG